MPVIFEFLLKVNIALVLFCAGYFLVLRRLTFYSLNRVYLITAILFATVYPNIDLTSFARQHEHLAQPVQTVILYWKAPAQTLATPLAHLNYWLWAGYIFWSGVFLLSLRLVIQLFSLLKLYRNSQQADIYNHRVRIISGQAAPFSFWRSIYINPVNHNPTDLKAILLHEQVHVNEWHTIDILLAELSSIFYWFNPGVWLMKKAVRENIEFITDRKILNKGIDSKTYQYSLVNVSFNNTTPGIVNHFNISTIKKRIMMMNAKRSSGLTLTRYAFVVPAVIALLLVFTLSKAELRKPIAAGIVKGAHPFITAFTKAVNKADTIIHKTKTVRVYASANDTGKVRAFTVKILDTNRKDKIIFLNDSKLSDSTTLVVNGKKIKPSEFKNIDPEHITAINIVSAENAKKILTSADNVTLNKEKQIVFVTTKDSEEGKKLLNRIDNNRQLTDLRIIHGDNVVLSGSVDNDDKLILQKTKPLTLRKDVKIITNGNLSTITSDDIREVVLDSGVMRVNGIKGSGITGTTSNTRSLTGVRINGDDIGPVTVSGFSNTPGEVYSVDAFRRNGSAGINRISDKLIIIDGKEASEKELKKISAFDIDRMEVQSSSDTIKKYGSKAKYGVVYIYTKRAKQETKF